MTPEGNIPIPQDVIARMGLKPGMDFVIDEAQGEIRLRPDADVFAPDLPRVTVDEFLNRPRYKGPPPSLEDISRLSNEAILRILLDQANRARDCQI